MVLKYELLYADKEKLQGLINKQQKTLADVEYLDLEYVANIIKNFENPNPERNRENLRKKDIKIPNAFGNAIKYRKLRGKNRSKMIKKTETAQM